MARPNWSLILDLQEAYAANAYCTEFITYLEDELLDLQNGNLIVTKRNAQLQAELSLKNAENEELRRMLEERSQREVEVSSDHQRSSDDHDGISYTDESILGNTGRSLDYMLDHPFSSITMKGRQLSSPFKQNNDCPRMGKLRRSVSESNVIDMRASLEESESEEEEQIKGVFSPSQGRGRFGIASSVTDMRTRVETSPKRDSASFTVDDVQRRPHDFAPKRNFLRDACDVCGKPFGFRSHALKCQCCKVVCHTTCKDGTTFPCAPRSSAVAAKGDPAKYRPRFADFCPPASPMIPHIVIHLVTAMDDCCLHIRNIYRLKASERLIQDLLTQLKVRKSFPQLRSNGPGVLSGCLKRFLLDLKDPIIPISSSSEFAKYASNEVALQQILCELPIPNQETLQFLCLHWQRVIENSDVNRMDSRELAKALAPVVFGNSSVDKADLVNAMEALLELRNWRDLVSYNHNRAPLTPFGSRQKSFKARAGLPPAPNAARWRIEIKWTEDGFVQQTSTMGRFDALLCLLLCLEGVLSQDPQEIGFHRVNLKEGETFLLTLSDLPLLGSVMVSVESPQISLEVHIASPEERRSALGNFGLVEGDYSPYFRDFGRISALSGWHNNMWTAETTHKAMTITRFHGVEAVSADDSFRHVALFRAKLFRIDDVRCLHNVLHAALPGELRSQSFFSGFLHCPRFLLSNFPVTTLSAFSLKGNGSATISKVPSHGKPFPIFSLDQATAPSWTPTPVASYALQIELPPSATLNFTISTGDRGSQKVSSRAGSLGAVCSRSYGMGASSFLQSSPPSLRRSIETFELSSPSPLLYHLYIADITENANFNLSTEYGSIFVKKYPGWTVDLFVSRVRLDYLETGERGFLLRYSVSKNIMEQSFLRGVPYSTRPEDSGLILWIR